MKFDFHVYLHSNHGELLRTIRSLLAAQGAAIMASVQDLTQAVTDLAGALAPLPDAVNALEAAVTAAKSSGSLSATDQQALDDAVNNLKGLTANVQAAVADATDGVDEASQPANPPADTGGGAPPADQPPTT